jgi:hypothetical protein
MNGYVETLILLIVICTLFFSKTILSSIGISSLVITILLIGIYNEVKKLNEDDYRE